MENSCAYFSACPDNIKRQDHSNDNDINFDINNSNVYLYCGIGDGFYRVDFQYDEKAGVLVSDKRIYKSQKRKSVFKNYPG